MANNELKKVQQVNADELVAEFDRESNIRRFTGFRKIIITVLVIMFAAFLFITRFKAFNETMPAFLGFVMFLGFLLYPAYKKQSKKVNYIPWYDFILAVVAAAPFFYRVIRADYILNNPVMIRKDVLSIVIGAVAIVAIFELCRRAVGLPILFVAGAFIIYDIYVVYADKNFDIELFDVIARVVKDLFYTQSGGIFSSPINVCSTFIVFFIIFGAFLEKTGIGNFFVDLANSIAGWASGGPAKVAVISSALEGMYSGSSVANTVGSGSITIPTMKKIGYKPEFAAAVEAAASTGGQIMPPIMGAAAFLMTEYTGLSYPVIALSAILPALLYFTGIFMMIHFEAKKLGLNGLPKESIPNFFKLLFSKGYLLLPVVVLIAMMSNGGSPAKSACMAIIVTLAIMLIMDAIRIFKNMQDFKPLDLLLALPLVVFSVLMVVFRIGLENAGLISGFLYVFICFLNKKTIETGKLAIDAFETGVKNTMGVAAACAIAGIVSGVVSATGLGITLISVVKQVANGNLLIALMLTMLACIILGMGVPTTANYVIMATTTAPILAIFGLPPLAAHMFVFYFGIVADITPPVALAAYAGSAIAGSNPLKTGVTATRLAITAFIIPYIFAFNPKMLFINATAWEIVLIIVTSCIGIFAISAALEGHMFRKLRFYEIPALIAGGLLMIYPGVVTDVIGLFLVAAIVVLQYIDTDRGSNSNKKVKQ